MTTNHPAHGTVSIERLHQIREILSKAAAQCDGGNLGYAMADAVKVINVAIVSFDAEPVAWECGENIILFNPDTVEAYAKRAEISPKPLYATPPVQETGVYQDMLNIIGLLENNEWAEHCTSTVLGSLLESEITRLVSKEQPAPVVPDDWVMVPKEPTRQMMAQGHFAMKGTDRGKFRRIYQAMITAASALNKGEY